MDFLWLAAAAGLGFLLPAVFAGWLGLPRDLYLVPYVGGVLGFLGAYVRWSGADVLRRSRRRWRRGVAGALVAGSLVAWHVVSQPPSTRPAGWDLALAVLWPGLVYGAVDGLFLSVMPVVAAGRAAPGNGRLAALLASGLVTAAYHLGYPEFRGAAVLGPVAGNSVLTAAYLVTGSPIAAVGGHVVMHVAAVLHGIDTTVQLPPHDEIGVRRGTDAPLLTTSPKRHALRPEQVRPPLQRDRLAWDAALPLEGRGAAGKQLGVRSRCCGRSGNTGT